MSEPLRWGILGTGNIANQFAGGVTASDRGRLVAVGSRDEKRAQAFAKTYGIASSYGSYEAVLTDAQVQAVYISLPNAMHHQWTLAALRSGKHVLCEKPAAVTVEQAEEMFAQATKHGRVLVEAFMYRSHPQTAAVIEVVRSGAIGELRMIRTSFCFRVRHTEGNIRFDASLAGGSLMDIGCYCLDFSQLMAGEQPEVVTAAGVLHSSGVDEYTAGAMRFPSGVLGSFACGMALQADNAALVCGTGGYLTIPWPWKPQAARVEFYRDGMTPPRQDHSGGSAPQRQVYAVEADRPLYALEADAFAATVQDAAPPAMTAEETIGNTRSLVALRRQLGLGF